MGTDIHFFLEKKENNMWVNKNKVSINVDWEEDCDYPQSDIILEPTYSERNYLVFGILAKVRHLYKIDNLGEPKGLPDDVSDEIKHMADNFDGHSHSWVTLKELKDFDWDFVTDIYGQYSCDDFTEVVFDKMLKLINYDPTKYNDVRGVFWFDS